MAVGSLLGTWCERAPPNRTPMPVDTWKDWLQIVVLALALFAGLRALARSRARNAAYGIGALLVLYLALRLAGFTIITRLLDEALRVGLILLVVLFRDEARALLVVVGKRLRHMAGREPAEVRAAPRLIEEMAAAMEKVARAGKGALIAIEQNDSLDAHAATGYPIGGLVSAPLLEAIFTSSSPMHDGAVIVRGERVVAARAVLPLMRETTGSAQHLGTRHRAALGLSEVTDAIVLVVSEERGTIRVARGGTLLEFDPEHLRRELLALLVNDEEPERPLRLPERLSRVPALLSATRLARRRRRG